MNITTVGIDLAKNVFQVHGVDARGKVVLRRQLRREQVARFFVKLPPCLIGMEACASSHHWGHWRCWNGCARAATHALR
jgi:transposase